MITLIKPDDCGLSRNDIELPSFFATSGSKTDPHYVGQIISGTLYDLFVDLYDDSIVSGHTPESSIAQAKSIVGALMMRALSFVGEHSVSFHDYAVALLRLEQHIYDGRYRDALLEALGRRGLIDQDEDIDAEISRREDLAPMFHLNPETVDHGKILKCVEELEKRQLEKVRDILVWREDEQDKVILLRHKAEFPFKEDVKSGEFSVYSDVTAADGLRVIRFHHTLSIFCIVQDSEKDWSMPGTVIDDFEECAFDVFASLVFNRHGKLIVLHADRPQLNDLR